MFFDLNIKMDRCQKKDRIQISFSSHSISNLHPYKLCVGSWLFELEELNVHCSNENWFQIKNPSKRNLLFLERKWQGYYAVDSATLFLGPVLAVLTETKGTEKNIHFPSIEEFCLEMDHLSQKRGGFLYVANLNYFKKEKGYFWDEHRWKKETLPLPNIMYNRIHSRKKESSKAFRNARRILKKHHICFFNESFLDKWTVYQLLKNKKDICSYLPETSLLRKESLLNMLAESPVYIKPITGSQGKNILYAEQNDGKISIHSTGKIFNKNEMMEIQAFLTKLFHSLQPSSFLIQKKIDLLMPEQCLLDFRILCHCLSDHNWKVTSIVARTGKKQEIVTNISQGGRLENPKAFLKKFFPSDFLRIFQSMIQLATRAAKAIGQNVKGNFFELGVDIGIDLKGKPWLIEVNSKPSKKMASASETIRPSALTIFHITENIWKEQMKFKRNHSSPSSE
jgi:glutathione synthase/RimK-type ligase-like ATP-grasp enzyme